MSAREQSVPSALQKVEAHLAETGWVFLSIYDGSDGRWAAKYFHPKAKGSFLIVEKFSPEGKQATAFEVYSVLREGPNVALTIDAIDALIEREPSISEDGRREAVSHEVLALAGLLSTPEPGLATWHQACERKYRGLIAAISAETEARLRQLERQVSLYRDAESRLRYPDTTGQ